MRHKTYGLNFQNHTSKFKITVGKLCKIGHNQTEICRATPPPPNLIFPSAHGLERVGGGASVKMILE